MNSILIQTEIKSIEEELKAIKQMMSGTTGTSKNKYLSDLKNLFPQTGGVNEITDLEMAFKKSRSEKI